MLRSAVVSALVEAEVVIPVGGIGVLSDGDFGVLNPGSVCPKDRPLAR